ncbi:Sensory box histidine kinase [Minicystis rosea]|nr:Sensory box histidine kinase [Minicystis rosea]
MHEELERRVASRTAELEEANRRLREDAHVHASAEEARRRAEDRRMSLIESIDAIVWQSDPRGAHFDFVSQKAEKILGYPIARWIDEPTFWADHVHPDDRAPSLARCAQAAAERRDHEMEYRMIAADGRVVWVHDRITLVIEEGELVKRRGIMTDITARKQAEEERALLRAEVDESHALLDTLFRSAPIGISYLDRSLRYARINDALAAIHDLPVEDHIGRSVADVFPSMSAEIVKKCRTVLATGSPIVGVDVTPDRRSWLVIFYPVRRGDVILGVGKIVQEITEQKRAEQELAEQRMRLELALEVAKCGWFDWNIQTGINSWSKEAEALHGLPPGGFGGTYEAWRRCVHPDDLVEAEARIQKCFETGDFFDDFRVVWPDGSVHWLLTRARLLRDAEGRPMRLLGVNVDVTDLVEARVRIEALAVERGRLLIEAQRALRARDVFLTVASHELKTPLTPLLLNLQLVRREVRETPGDRCGERLDIALRQIDRLSRLIETMLDVARCSSGRLALQPVPADVSALVRDVASRLSPEAARVGSPVALQASSPAMANIDPARIGQVVEELLANAIRYGAGKAIMVTVAPAGEMIRVAVEDDGIGVAPEDRERIFGLFERAVSERRYGGLGLGLFLARRIVEAHGGRIHCTGQRGAGTRFEVDLPRATVEAA